MATIPLFKRESVSKPHVRNLWENADSALIERNGLKATIEPSATHGLALSSLQPCIRYEKAY